MTLKEFLVSYTSDYFEINDFYYGEIKVPLHITSAVSAAQDRVDELSALSTEDVVVRCIAYNQELDDMSGRGTSYGTTVEEIEALQYDISECLLDWSSDSIDVLEIGQEFIDQAVSLLESKRPFSSVLQELSPDEWLHQMLEAAQDHLDRQIRIWMDEEAKLPRKQEFLNHIRSLVKALP